MEISPRQLQQVLAIDRFRHFGRAAEYLGISQPALSRSLQSVEAALGLALFLRDRRGVEPTAAGLKVIAFARAARGAADQLSREIAELREGESARLRIACGAFPAELSAIEALGRLQLADRRPAIDLEVADWSEALRMLRSRRCALALCELNPDFIAPDLRTRPVGQHPISFVARAGHPLARGQRPGLEKVLAYPWAGSRVPMRALTHIGDRSIGAGEIDLATGMMIPRLATSSVHGTLAMLHHTDCIAPAPLALAAPLLESGQLKIIDFQAPWMKLNYGFAWPAHAPLPPAANRFMAEVNAIEERVREREAALARRFLAPSGRRATAGTAG